MTIKQNCNLKETRVGFGLLGLSTNANYKFKANHNIKSSLDEFK